MSTTHSASRGAIWPVMLVAVAAAIFWWSQRSADKSSAEKAMPSAQPATMSATPSPMHAAPTTAGDIAKALPVPTPAEPTPPMLEVPPKPAAPSPAAVPDAFAQPAVLDQAAAKNAANLKHAEAALDEAFTKNKWAEYRDWLRAGLAAELKKQTDFSQPQSYDRALKNPSFYQALLQHTLLYRLPRDARSYLSEDTGSRSFFTWLLKTPEAAESLLASLRPEDSAGEVLRIWALLAAEDDGVRGKYRELALAIALVFDKPFRPRWNSETLTITPRERYEYYRELNEKGQLETHLNSYSASDLVWVVADPVPLSEMDWARKKVHLRQKTWGSAYEMVKYDMEKAVTGQSKKPYDSYTFAEILEKGGICADRAYFATYTGRANGIPAAIISGDGPRGGHDWIRWMPDDQKWAEAGRIGGYAAGTALDPQTGRRISEQEFVRRSDPREAGAQRKLTAHRFLWIADLQQALTDVSKADLALDLALKTSPRLSIAWDAKLAHWRKHHHDDTAAAWDEMVRDIKRRFSDDKIMLAEAQKLQEEFVFPRQDVRDSIHDLKQDVKKYKDPRVADTSKDVETLTATVHREGQLLADAGQTDALHQLYRRALTDNGGNPAAWRGLARDYFAFLGNADASEREKAARQIENTYERNVETRTLDWFAVGAQNSAHALVADCWKACGDTEKADRIAKEIERRTKQSKRGAL